MNAKLIPFVDAVQNITGAVQDRHRIAAIAIGLACSCNSQLPTSKVEDTELHYRNIVEGQSKIVISQLNEAIVFDSKLALDFARKFWLLRYNAVYNCARVDSVKGDFFASVFGIAKFFPPELVEFADNNNVSISSVYLQACNFIQEQFEIA